MSGCSAKRQHVFVPSLSSSFPRGTILSAAEKAPVSFETMINDLAEARVVYIGESHTNPRHHEIQKKILKALYRRKPGLSVGMEMFSRPYQDVLGQWRKGMLDQKTFIENVHWYANWKHDYSLYSGLLDFIKEKNLPLCALNIPFHIPSKIAAGGIDSLLPGESGHLPEQIKLDVAAHRQYLKNIFESHHRARLHYNFKNFYQAQCVWDEAMAQSVSRCLKDSLMVVFAGKGHIIYGFGIPDRAYRRTGAPFKTVIPFAAGQSADLSAADYLWVTTGGPAGPSPH
ncbi:MAG: ChaN family lipoprotein [Desulfobacterales bacterium]|nr:ChaN family lipoprotein [Desulfobacterales bacterium]